MFSLNDRSIIEISGEDRQNFLQGFITNDLKLLNDNNLIYTAFLNASGRYLADFFIFLKDQKIFIDCHKNSAQEIVKKLNLYKLKAQINVKINQELAVFFSTNNLKIDQQFIDPRLNNFGYRFYQDFAQNDNNKIDNVVNYHLHRIINKIPEGHYDLIYDKSFIAEYDFDNLNAVSYNKGCYVGQETTARNHFRGVVRKKIFYFEIKNCSQQLIDFLNNYDNLNSLQIDYENLKLRGFFDNSMIEDENNKEIGMVLSNIYFKSTNEIKGLALIKINENHQIISSNLNFLNNQILIKN